MESMFESQILWVLEPTTQNFVELLLIPFFGGGIVIQKVIIGSALVFDLCFHNMNIVKFSYKNNIQGGNKRMATW